MLCIPHVVHPWGMVTDTATGCVRDRCYCSFCQPGGKPEGGNLRHRIPPPHGGNAATHVLNMSWPGSLIYWLNPNGSLTVQTMSLRAPLTGHATTPRAGGRISQRHFSYDSALSIMREYNKGTMTCAALAEREGVDRKMMWNMLHGVTYRDIWVTAQRELERNQVNWGEPPVASTVNRPTTHRLKQVLAALQSRPGEWALVKQTRNKPQVSYWHAKGLETACRRLANGEWGVYARWPETEPLSNAA